MFFCRSFSVVMFGAVTIVVSLLQMKLDNREYTNGAEFAADVRTIFTNCYKYNPSDHDVVVMARKLQDVFEMQYSKVNGDDPFEVAAGGSDSSDGSGESESETDFSEDERERKLVALQEQLRQVQEQMKVCHFLFFFI